MRDAMGTSYTFLHPLCLDLLFSHGPFQVFL